MNRFFVNICLLYLLLTWYTRTSYLFLAHHVKFWQKFKSTRTECFLKEMTALSGASWIIMWQICYQVCEIGSRSIDVCNCCVKTSSWRTLYVSYADLAFLGKTLDWKRNTKSGSSIEMNTLKKYYIARDLKLNEMTWKADAVGRITSPLIASNDLSRIEIAYEMHVYLRL